MTAAPARTCPRRSCSRSCRTSRPRPTCWSPAASTPPRSTAPTAPAWRPRRASTRSCRPSATASSSTTRATTGPPRTPPSARRSPRPSTSRSWPASPPAAPDGPASGLVLDPRPCKGDSVTGHVPAFDEAAAAAAALDAAGWKAGADGDQGQGRQEADPAPALRDHQRAGRAGRDRVHRRPPGRRSASRWSSTALLDTKLAESLNVTQDWDVVLAADRRSRCPPSSSASCPGRRLRRAPTSRT